MIEALISTPPQACMDIISPMIDKVRGGGGSGGLIEISKSFGRKLRAILGGTKE
jgi:hypothetical protein